MILKFFYLRLKGLKMINYQEYLLDKYQKLVLDAKEVAEVLDVSKRKVVESCAACSADVPPFKKIGREYKFPINGVADFLSDGFVEVI